MIATNKDIVMFELDQDPEEKKKQLDEAEKQNENLSDWPYVDGA